MWVTFVRILIATNRLEFGQSENPIFVVAGERKQRILRFIESLQKSEKRRTKSQIRALALQSGLYAWIVMTQYKWFERKMKMYKLEYGKLYKKEYIEKLSEWFAQQLNLSLSEAKKVKYPSYRRNEPVKEVRIRGKEFTPYVSPEKVIEGVYRGVYIFKKRVIVVDYNEGFSFSLSCKFDDVVRFLEHRGEPFPDFVEELLEEAGLKELKAYVVLANKLFT